MFDKRQWFLVLVFIVIPTAVIPAQAIEPQSQDSDIRVLIDVSGSMKKNDPKNLRLPALRLLVGLLPKNSNAAIWNFGTKTKSLVPLGTTDEQWKAKANLASKKIHSKDLFTNIGLALEASISGWDIPSIPVSNSDNTEQKEQSSHQKNSERHIILLTDGMVDISKDDNKNIAERTRLLKELLPEIEKTGAKIHTIALSKNADHDFLKQLSTKTDGGYEQTDNAEQLERIFFHLFEKTTKVDTVPLIDNTFLIDQSIIEVTLLVFKGKDAKPTIVVEPDKNSYQKSNMPKYVKWQSEKNYDLITITRPKIGEWSINAQTDPDNRVMVITNLQIQTARLPNNIFAGETLNIALFLIDNNKKIIDDNFLHFTSIIAKQTKPNQKRWFLHDNGLRGDKEANDGIYNVSINQSLSIGKNQFILQAKSDTFQREINYSVLVHEIDLINTRVSRTEINHTNYHQIIATPNIEFIRARDLKLSGVLITGDIPLTKQSNAERLEDIDNARPINLRQKSSKVLEWEYKTNKLNPEKDYHIIFHMLGKTRNGRPVDYISRPIQLNIAEFNNPPMSPDQLIIDESVVSPPKVLRKAPESKIQKEAEVISTILEENSHPAEENSDWLIGIIITIIANIILGVAGWFGYRKWKKVREAAYADITGELE